MHAGTLRTKGTDEPVTRAQTLTEFAHNMGFATGLMLGMMLGSVIGSFIGIAAYEFIRDCVLPHLPLHITR